MAPSVATSSKRRKDVCGKEEGKKSGSTKPHVLGRSGKESTWVHVRFGYRCFTPNLAGWFPRIRFATLTEVRLGGVGVGYYDHLNHPPQLNLMPHQSSLAR